MTGPITKSALARDASWFRTQEQEAEQVAQWHRQRHEKGSADAARAADRTATLWGGLATELEEYLDAKEATGLW